ncbi:MAG: PilN domain-containing protein [Verrucomicrobiota bacterium]|nr:PilN domain-containing protein [Verrucomicrobiota bacterium]
MPLLFNKILEKLQRKLPPSSVLLLPGECFFGRSFPLPDGVTDAEVQEFAELSLEGISPFPIDQLAWGYLHHADSKHIYIYAASLGRLRQLGFDNLASYEQVIPSFAASYGIRFKEAVVFASISGTTLSAVYLSAHNPVPTKVVSILIPEDKREGPILRDFASTWLKSLDTKGYAIDKAPWECSAPEVYHDGLKLHIATESSEAPRGEDLIFGAKGVRLWDVDVRDTAFAQRQIRQRSLSARIWTVARVGAYTLLVLIALQFISWGLHGWNWWRTAKIERRREEVSKVERNLDMINRITDITGQQMKPFAMLNETNLNRPANIYFTRVNSKSWNELEVEGRATSLDEVNQFVDGLRNSPMVKGVINDQPKIRNGRAEFRLLFTFNELPDLPEPAPSTTDATPTTPPPTSAP